MKRFYSLWLYAVILASLAAGSIQGLLEDQRLKADAATRSAALASSLEDSFATHFESGQWSRLDRIVKRLQTEQKLVGAAICDYDNGVRSITPDSRGFPSSFVFEPLCLNGNTKNAAFTHRDESHDITWSSGPAKARVLYLAHKINDFDGAPGTHSLVMVLARDVTYLNSQWVTSFLRGFLVTLVVSLALLVLIATQSRQWLKANLKVFHRTLRSLIAGGGNLKRLGTSQIRGTEELSELRPITEDIDQLARILSLQVGQNSKTGSLSDKSLPASLQNAIAHRNLIVIANREPYIHNRNKEGTIEVVRPASGLVTALEPILRQTGGLWIAHGSGNADFEAANAQGEVAVPPENPTYTLRRVPLTPEEEEGYYYGFSNEGLWPLCHLAHNRPSFRLSDWKYYSKVNQKFADAIPNDSITQDSLFLIQDYHFALVPKMLRDRDPAKNPKIALFWHIPWPNPEAFGICPWGQDLLKGILGADVIGFHTQYHCNNFLESCNRYLEARVDNERFSVTMGNHETLVRAFPIGIDTTPVRVLNESERVELKQRFGIHAEKVAVGVDRIDYTKGIIERVEAVERFLEKHPEQVGKFALVQMGSPSRTHIPAYQHLFEALNKTVDRVNQRFSGGATPEGYRPIVFLPNHHEWRDIQYFYQLGDICMVTSLHDGMNLVAKEYVWCQTPDRGSLILSKFTGACRELTEAFIVNPYSIEEMADAIAAALALSPEEKARRMMRMREKVHTQNAFRWASNLIESLIRKGGDIAPSRKTAEDPRGRSRSATFAGLRL
jgi:trehalose-6-phosphate synthase